jgi:hypothetical protein
MPRAPALISTAAGQALQILTHDVRTFEIQLLRDRNAVTVTGMAYWTGAEVSRGHEEHEEHVARRVSVLGAHALATRYVNHTSGRPSKPATLESLSMALVANMGATGSMDSSNDCTGRPRLTRRKSTPCCCN